MRTQNVKDIDFIVLCMGQNETKTPWHIQDISSSFARIYYVEKGKAVFHLTNGDVEMSPGHMYLIPPNQTISYDCEAGLCSYYLLVNPCMRTDIFDLYEYPFEVRSNEATRLLFENYCTLYPQLSLPTMGSAQEFEEHSAFSHYAATFAAMQPYEKLQLQGLALILFSYFQKRAHLRESVSDSRVMDLVKYIQENVNESITLDQLAERACLTKCSVIRAFKNAMGVSPLQYVNRKKVQQAQSYLLTTNMSVSEIAHALGVNDVSYFIRMFHKILGYTPMEYRMKQK